MEFVDAETIVLDEAARATVTLEESNNGWREETDYSQHQENSSHLDGNGGLLAESCENQRQKGVKENGKLGNKDDPKDSRRAEWFDSRARESDGSALDGSLRSPAIPSEDHPPERNTHEEVMCAARRGEKCVSGGDKSALSLVSSEHIHKLSGSCT